MAAAFGAALRRRSGALGATAALAASGAAGWGLWQRPAAADDEPAYDLMPDKPLRYRGSATKALRKAKKPHPCSMHNRFVQGCSEVKVFAGSANPELAKEVAEGLGTQVGKASVARFADGEVSVKIDESVRGKDVYIVQPTSPPVNENLMELLLMVSALRHASAKRVSIIVPYFGYMRSLSQSVISRDHEDWNYARSNLAAKDVAHMMEVAGAQRVVAVDMYPVGQGMAEGFFDRAPIEQISSSDAIIDDLVDKLELSSRGFGDGDLVVVAPHASCLAKAKQFRNELVNRVGYQIDLATIIRTPPPPKSPPGTSRKVDLVGNVEGKSVLIVEDLIETGRTTVSAVDAVLNAGAKDVSAYASHCLLSSGAAELLQASGLRRLVTLNTVPIAPEKAAALPKLRQLSIAPEIASLIRQMHYEEK